jgi:hypothetical protein
VENLPSWFLPSVIGLLIGGTVVGTVIIQVIPKDNNKNPTPLSTPSVKYKDAIITVRDSKTGLSLEDVNLEIVTDQGNVLGKTNRFGSYRFQLPAQKLGVAYITFSRSGYKTVKNLQVGFLLNNTPTIIHLEQD